MLSTTGRPLDAANSFPKSQIADRPVGDRQSPKGRRLFGRPSYPCCSMEDVAMRDFDLTPIWRSTVGFDRLVDLIDDSLRLAGEDNYPPYNIARTGEDNYRISLALAGFKPEEITVTAEQNMLTVEGRKADKDDREYLYQGISGRPFRRQFNLADYVEVKGASFEDGLLQVDLVRELPEAMKPRRIAVKSGPSRGEPQQIEQKQAA